MSWDIKDDRPVYAQLVEIIGQMIIKNIFPPDSKLPSVRDLAALAEVNPNTMQKALVELESEGLISSVRTTGKYVTDNVELIKGYKRKIAVRELGRFINKMKDLDFTMEEIKDLVDKEVNNGNSFRN
ncbi:MAG: GntR family transcriptional regulator [Firmicutes bacterium]|nr:GntR family transcriptional regulator [Bacillota bacterium]